MSAARKLVSLDWAIKRLLRSKADFVILEGFLSELLFEDVTIIEILEGESNKDGEDDKFCRVDVKVKNAKGEIIIVEIQFDSEYDYFQRILFGVSKAVCEQIEAAMDYENIKKVISVNIVYFDLGQGEDYVYHGVNRFVGMHHHDVLRLSAKQAKHFDKAFPHDLYPEYYVLKINAFDDVAKDTLDEWIYFLKNEEIKDDFKAKGIREASEKLSVLKLSDKDKKAYQHYLENKAYAQSLAKTYKIDLEWERKAGKAEGLAAGKAEGLAEGKAEGLAEGKAKGLAEGKAERDAEIARNCIKQGMDTQSIVNITGLSSQAIDKLRGKD